MASGADRNMAEMNGKGTGNGPVRVIGGTIGFVFSMIGRMLLTFMMVGIITGCIVASVLTVYVLRYIGSEEQVNLENIKLGYTSIIYGTDKNGGIYELQRLYNVEGNRIWVDLDQISDNVQKALIAVEDKRFETHEGVDWRRTFGAFVNMFIPGASTGGGSTLHQQLIKNLTGNDELRIDRKIGEIFGAMDLSQRYTREQVLEAYLNVVPFGNNTKGIQAAANTYFDKDAKDLTLAEAACIVGITQKPTAYNPFFFPEANKKRQEWVLFEMFDQKRITQSEYDRAVNETLNFKKAEHYESLSEPQSYFVDYVIDSVIEALMDKYSWTYSYATERLYQDGMSIYTTVDMEMQTFLEEYYSSAENFPKVIRNPEYPQSACVITDLNGKILAMVGGIGEKTVSRGFNRATMAKRQPGSSIKPLGVYALNMEYNRITWSTLIDDNPINPEAPPNEWYPVNFTGVYRGPTTIDYAVSNSLNTVAVKLTQEILPRRIFDFLKSSLCMDSLIERLVVGNRILSDVDLAPMALGGLTEGVTPLEMAGGYQMFANGGYFTKPYAFTKVEDSEGKIILETDTTPRRVIGEDTSVVLNKLLQRVTSVGTGRSAHLGTVPTAGKTGTSTDDVDQWFIGFTPYYVCQVWLGYDEKNANNNYGKISYSSYAPPLIFKDIMTPLHEGLESRAMPESPNVVSMMYCNVTGDLASSDCTDISTGWYKKNRLPGMCTGHPVIDDYLDSENINDMPFEREEDYDYLD